MNASLHVSSNDGCTSFYFAAAFAHLDALSLLVKAAKSAADRESAKKYSTNAQTTKMAPIDRLGKHIQRKIRVFPAAELERAFNIVIDMIAHGSCWADATIWHALTRSRRDLGFALADWSHPADGSFQDYSAWPEPFKCQIITLLLCTSRMSEDNLRPRLPVNVLRIIMRYAFPEMKDLFS